MLKRSQALEKGLLLKMKDLKPGKKIQIYLDFINKLENPITIEVLENDGIVAKVFTDSMGGYEFDFYNIFDYAMFGATLGASITTTNAKKLK